MNEKVYLLITHPDDDDTLTTKAFKTKEGLQQFIKSILKEEYDSLINGYFEKDLEDEFERVISDLEYSGWSSSFEQIYIYRELELED